MPRSKGYDVAKILSNYGSELETIGVAGGSLLVGRHTVWVPSGSMVTRVTTGAVSGSVELSSNRIILPSWNFHASTQQHVQFSIGMPKSWNESTFTAQFIWSHASTATNFGVVWGLQAVALSNDDAADANFGTAQTIVDTGGTTNDLYISDETAAITVGNTPAELDYVIFQPYRVAANGSDTLAIDARLHGIRLFYNINAGDDS